MSVKTALIGNIQKFSTQDGPGIRSTVFLKGCPLRCLWCHNPEMIRPEQQMIVSPSRCIKCLECVSVCPEQGIVVTENGPMINFDKCRACGACAHVCYAKAISPVGKEMTVEDVMAEVLRDRGFYESSGGGITLSGGEVLMHYVFAKALISACEAEDVHVCLDTCGFGDTEQFLDLASMPNVDYILFDIKHMDTEKHRQLTGEGNELIQKNLRMLTADPELRKKIWIRMPLISDLNDGEETINQTVSLMEELGIRKLSLLGYNEMGISKARNTGVRYEKFEAPSKERMEEIMKQFTSVGVDVEISGVSV